MSQGKSKRNVPASVLLVIGILLVTSGHKFIGGLAGSILALVGDLFILFAIIGFFRWLVSKSKNNSVDENPYLNLSLDDMASITLHSVQSKQTEDSSNQRKVYEDVDRKAVILMAQFSKEYPSDTYALWFQNEAREALKQNDTDRLVLMSAISSCLSEATTSAVPIALEGLSDYESFYVLYGTILRQIGEQMLTNHKG